MMINGRMIPKYLGCCEGDNTFYYECTECGKGYESWAAWFIHGRCPHCQVPIKGEFREEEEASE